jgi:hypothetical protein
MSGNILYWKKVDSNIFLLALVFNPYIQTDVFASTSTFCSVGTLWPLVSWVYKLMFDTTDKPSMEFQSDFMVYLH